MKTTNKNDMYISIIIPAYNEEKRIGTTLDSVFLYLNNKDYNSEVYVVDDGSSDATIEIINKYREKNNNLKLLILESNHGKGYAVRQGMNVASGKWRLFMDADNSVSIDYLDQFIQFGDQGYEVVIGSIAYKDKSDSIVEHNGWYRRLLGNLSRFLIRTFATPGIYDTQRGFKLFSDRAASVVFNKQTIKRFGFDIELLVISKIYGFYIKELPVIWNNPAGSTVRPRDYLLTLLELGEIIGNRLTNRYN